MKAPRCMPMPPEKGFSLSPDEVHIWISPLDYPEQRLSDFASTLDGNEHARAHRFYFERDRRRFVAARGILRTLLGRYLGECPDGIQFSYGARGKPTVAGPDRLRNVRFNLSHSNGYALFAFTVDREIGVDLERIRPLPEASGIVSRYFSPHESALFHTIPMNGRLDAFFKYWTCKEAFLKAKGDGLSYPLDQVEVELAPGGGAGLLRIDRDPREASRWSLRDFVPIPGYAGAIAVEGHDWSLVWPS
ncbi:MAG: 4'-phosphopantetheinyl transferase superfamily protein [Acidobacteria bacterium]|nr:4'-phosphopantetheinyl transferase superfamily protein [Acidobacteriota bacterium]